MNIFLSCTKTKENKKCKAVEMYMPSSLFQKSYEYAKTLTSDENDIYIIREAPLTSSFRYDRTI